MSFLEKIQNVNNYKMNIDKQKNHKSSDNNNSYDAKDKVVVRNDIVTEVRLCITR